MQDLLKEWIEFSLFFVNYNSRTKSDEQLVSFNWRTYTQIVYRLARLKFESYRYDFN